MIITKFQSTCCYSQISSILKQYLSSLKSKIDTNVLPIKNILDILSLSDAQIKYKQRIEKQLALPILTGDFIQKSIKCDCMNATFIHLSKYINDTKILNIIRKYIDNSSAYDIYIPSYKQNTQSNAIAVTLLELVESTHIYSWKLKSMNNNASFSSINAISQYCTRIIEDATSELNSLVISLNARSYITYISMANHVFSKFKPNYITYYLSNAGSTYKKIMESFQYFDYLTVIKPLFLELYHLNLKFIDNKMIYPLCKALTTNESENDSMAKCIDNMQIYTNIIPSHIASFPNGIDIQIIKNISVLVKHLNNNFEIVWVIQNTSKEDILKLCTMGASGIEISVLNSFDYMIQQLTAILKLGSLKALIKFSTDNKDNGKYYESLLFNFKIVVDNFQNIKEKILVLQDPKLYINQAIQQILEKYIIIIENRNNKITMILKENDQSLREITIEMLKEYLFWIYINYQNSPSSSQALYKKYMDFYNNSYASYKSSKALLKLGFYSNLVICPTEFISDFKYITQQSEKCFKNEILYCQKISKCFYLLQGAQIVQLLQYFILPKYSKSVCDIFKFLKLDINNYKSPNLEFQHSNDVKTMAKMLCDTSLFEKCNICYGLYFYDTSVVLEGIANIANNISLCKNDHIRFHSWQFLFCNKKLSSNEVIAFIKRALVSKLPHIMLYPENLSTSSQVKLMQYMKNELTFCQTAIGIINKVTNSKVNIFLKKFTQYVKLIPKCTIYSIENLDISLNNIMFVTGKAGSGKSYSIKQIHINDDGIKFISFYLMGNINIKKIIRAFLEIDPDDKICVIFEIGALEETISINKKSNEETATQIIYQIIFDKVLSYYDELFYLPENWKIYFEIKEECKSKNISELLNKIKISFPKAMMECLYLAEKHSSKIDSYKNSALIFHKSFNAEAFYSLYQRAKTHYYSNYHQRFLSYTILLKSYLGLLNYPYYANIIDNKDYKKELEEIILQSASSFIQNQTSGIVRWTELKDFISYFNEVGFMYLNPNDSPPPKLMRDLIVNQSIICNHKLSESSAENDAFPKIKNLNSNQLFALLSKWFLGFPQDMSEYYKTHFIITKDNYSKIVMAYIRLNCDLPVIMQGETGCGKTAIIKFMASFFGNQLIIINMHPGIKYSNIKKKINEIESDSLKLTGRKELWVFFDEFNTSNCVEIISDILITHSFEGRQLNPKIKLLAACNPYRLNKINCNEYGLPIETPVYSVFPIPTSLADYIWDFGELTFNDSQDYIKKLFDTITDTEILNMYCNSIYQSIEYSNKTITNLEVLSLRDLSRIKKFYINISELIIHAKLLNIECKEIYENNHSAIILSLYFNFVLRLSNENNRKVYYTTILSQYSKYNEVIDQFNKVITDEMILPEDIALNSTLIENLTMLFISIYTTTPLLICGKPGTSKSLSFTILIDSMKGEKSKGKLFKSLYYLMPIYFQGSETCNIEDVDKIFRTAIQNSINIKNFSQCRVVILFDEIGLASKSKYLPLNYLHSKLEIEEVENNKIAFIGISNWFLDFAKMNRMIKLVRIEPSSNELEITAKCILSDKLYSNYKKQVDSLASSYMFILNYLKGEEICWRDSYGLRDYYEMIKILKKKVLPIINTDCCNEENINRLSMECIDQCFGDISNSIQINKLFKEQFVKASTSMMIINTPFDALISYNLGSKQRYLMLISEKENFEYLINQSFFCLKKPFQIITPSCYEQNLSDFNYGKEILGRISYYAENGIPVVMNMMNSIYPNLYELFNRNYKINKDGQLVSKIWIKTNLDSECKVNPDFKVILLTDINKVQYENSPLLNRFEKHIYYKPTMIPDLIKNITPFAIPNEYYELKSICFPLESINHYLQAYELGNRDCKNAKYFSYSVSTIDAYFYAKFKKIDSFDTTKFRKQHQESLKMLISKAKKAEGNTANELIFARKEISINLEEDKVHLIDIDQITKELNLLSKIQEFAKSEYKSVFIFQMSSLKLCAKLWMLKSIICELIRAYSFKFNFIICIISHRNNDALSKAPIFLFNSFNYRCMEELSDRSDIDIINYYEKLSIENIASREFTSNPDLLAKLITNRLQYLPNYRADIKYLLTSESRGSLCIISKVYSTIRAKFCIEHEEINNLMYLPNNILNSATYEGSYENSIFKIIAKLSTKVIDILIKGKCLDMIEKYDDNLIKIWEMAFDQSVNSVDIDSFETSDYQHVEVFPFIYFDYINLIKAKEEKLMIEKLSNEAKMNSLSFYNDAIITKIDSSEILTKQYITSMCQLICLNEGFTNCNIEIGYLLLVNTLTSCSNEKCPLRANFVNFFIMKYNVLKILLEIIENILIPLNIEIPKSEESICNTDEMIISIYSKVIQRVIETSTVQSATYLEKLFYIGLNIKPLIYKSKDLLAKCNKYKFQINLWIGMIKLLMLCKAEDKIAEYAIKISHCNDWMSWDCEKLNCVNSIILSCSTIPNDFCLTQIYFGFLFYSTDIQVKESLMDIICNNQNIYKSLHSDFFNLIFDSLLKDKINALIVSSEKRTDSKLNQYAIAGNQIFYKLYKAYINAKYMVCSSKSQTVIEKFLNDNIGYIEGLLSFYKENSLNDECKLYIQCTIIIITKYFALLMHYCNGEIKNIAPFALIHAQLEKLNISNSQHVLLLGHLKKQFTKLNVNAVKIQNLINLPSFLTILQSVVIIEPDEDIIDGPICCYPKFNDPSLLNLLQKKSCSATLIILRFQSEIIGLQFLYHLIVFIKNVSHICYHENISKFTKIKKLFKIKKYEYIKNIWNEKLLILIPMLSALLPCSENTAIKSVQINQGSLGNNQLSEDNIRLCFDEKATLENFILNSTQSEKGSQVYSLLCFLCSLHNYLQLHYVNESQFKSIGDISKILIPMHQEKTHSIINSNKANISDIKLFNPFSIDQSCFIKFENLQGEIVLYKAKEEFTDFLQKKFKLYQVSTNQEVRYDLESLEMSFGEVLRNTVLLNLDLIPKFPSSMDINLYIILTIKKYIEFEPMMKEQASLIKCYCTTSKYKEQLPNEFIKLFKYIANQRHKYNGELKVILEAEDSLKEMLTGLSDLNNAIPISFAHIIEAYQISAIAWVESHYLSKNANISPSADIVAFIESCCSKLKDDVINLESALMLIIHRRTMCDQFDNYNLHELLSQNEFWISRTNVNDKESNRVMTEVVEELKELKVLDAIGIVYQLREKMTSMTSKVVNEEMQYIENQFGEYE